MNKSAIFSLVLLVLAPMTAALADTDLPGFVTEPLLDGKLESPSRHAEDTPSFIELFGPAQSNFIPSSAGARAAQFSGAPDELQADIPMHKALWKMYMDRALAYVKEGDFHQAQKMIDSARKEANASGGADFSLAATERIAGDILLAQKDMAGAERSYRRSVYLYEKAVDHDLNEYTAALSSYASFLKTSNRIREASKFEARANLLRANDHSKVVGKSAL